MRKSLSGTVQGLSESTDVVQCFVTRASDRQSASADAGGSASSYTGCSKKINAEYGRVEMSCQGTYWPTHWAA